MREYIENELESLRKSFIATPESREDLEAFAMANKGQSDALLMMMSIQYGYKLALENLKNQTL